MTRSQLSLRLDSLLRKQQAAAVWLLTHHPDTAGYSDAWAARRGIEAEIADLRRELADLNKPMRIAT